jgi:hypothetical protein
LHPQYAASIDARPTLGAKTMLGPAGTSALLIGFVGFIDS